MPEMWDQISSMLGMGEAAPDLWPKSEQQMAQDAFEAAAVRTRRPYQAAIDRPPDSKLGEVADFLAPQTPLDYALMFGGPLSKGMSPALKALGLGIAGAMTPDEAQAGIVSKLGRGLVGFAPGSIEDVVNRVVKYGERQPYLETDPHHGFTKLRTGKTPEEMEGSITGAPNIQRPLYKPEDLMGGEIIFTPGDRSVGGGSLKSVGGTKLETPQVLEAGPDYPFLHGDKPIAGLPEDARRLWANAPGQSTAMLNLGNEILERGNQPYLMYQAMGKRAVDSSKQMTLPAIDLAKQGSVSNEGAKFLNDWMEKKGVEDFPGWRSPKLREWAENATGTERSILVKGMDMGTAREAGFPDLGELRYLMTNPQLRSTPTGSVGLTISKFNPELGAVEQSLHSTYPTAVAGTEAGTFGGSIPWHVAAPDLHKNLMQAGDPVRFAERPDYYSTRMPVGLPKTQVVDQRWVDTVSEWMRKNPQLWAASGAIPVAGGAASQSDFNPADLLRNYGVTGAQSTAPGFGFQ